MMKYVNTYICIHIYTYLYIYICIYIYIYIYIHICVFVLTGKTTYLKNLLPEGVEDVAIDDVPQTYEKVPVGTVLSQLGYSTDDSGIYINIHVYIYIYIYI
jgi:hypothetical protein